MSKTIVNGPRGKGYTADQFTPVWTRMGLVKDESEDET
jgi:hypothetical protein